MACLGMQISLTKKCSICKRFYDLSGKMLENIVMQRIGCKAE